MNVASSTMQMRFAASAAAAALVAAAVIPTLPAHSTPAINAVSAPTLFKDVELTSAALANVAADLTGMAAAGSAAFDLGGLLQADLASAESIFNTIVGLPGALIGDVIGPIETSLNDLVSLNIVGALFAVASIPLNIIETLINVPLTVGWDIFSLLVVNPVEFLIG